MASSSSLPRPPPPPPASGWAGLPHDVLWSLFTALGQREVLSGAGLACAPWWRFARGEPALWRRIDLTVAPEDDKVEVDDRNISVPVYKKKEAKVCNDDPAGWKAMALAAVDRSAGQCEAFWGRADDDVLLYLADRASSMKSLHVTSRYDVSSQVFSKLIKKFPLLEELELVLKSDTYEYTTKSKQPSTNSWVELFISASKACSHLHHFKVHHDGKEWHSRSYYRRSRTRPTHFSIPKMHALHSLELFGDSFTKDMVMKIVDNCPRLESLNISDVPDLYKRYQDEVDLINKCSRIKYLQLPADSFEDLLDGEVN